MMLRAAITRIAATLSRPTGNANVAVPVREGILLQISDGRSRVGQGEASPLPGFSPDTIDACQAALIRLCDAPPAALDADAPIEPQLRARLDAIASFPPAARFAAETALLDLAGQTSRRPLHAMLAELAGAPVPNAVVPLSALIDRIEPEGALDAAWSAVERGVNTIKLKVGRPGRFDDELALLRRLRAELGPGVALRLDANGALPFASVAARLADLAAVGPELIEEPCAGRLADVAALMRSHQNARIPLAADESLQDPRGWDGVAAALASGEVRAVVLKPTVLGGMLACIDVARRARAVAPQVAVNVTHTFEGPVALGACIALALALPQPRVACGLDRHGALQAWPALRIPALTDCTIVPTAAPGLGLRTMRLEAT